MKVFFSVSTIRIFLLINFLIISGFASAQQIPRFNPDTIWTVHIDSAINIKSSRLTVETFIREIVNDTSFYEAFRNMKKYGFTAENSVYTYNKKNKVEGKLYRKIAHSASGTNKMRILARQDSGKIYKKNGKYDLYTVEMFDYILPMPTNLILHRQNPEAA